jgi:hypothetical protein
MNPEEYVDIGRKKNVILDSQILTNLMTCPRLTDFRFNMNLLPIAGRSNSIECGSIVHIFLEYYYRAIINGVSRDKAKGFGFAAAETYIRGCPHCTDFISTPEIPKPTCGHKINDFPGVRNTPKDNEGFKTGWQWVLDTCDQYCIYYASDHWVPLEVETVKGVILYEDDEIRILWKAKLDWIVDTNQGVFPVDHKTMKQNRNTISMNNQFIGQCLVMKTRNVIINKIGFQTTLKPVDKFVRSPLSYSAARLFEWQSETLPFYAKLLLMYTETGHFPPNFTSCDGKYGQCPFLSTCESNPDMREEELKRLFYVGPEWNPVNEGE